MDANVDFVSVPLVRFTKKGRDAWGPKGWFTIHFLTYIFVISAANIDWFCKFLEALKHLLPCDQCCQNLNYKIQKVPPRGYLVKPGGAFTLGYIYHDMANKDITIKNPDKPAKISPPFEEVKRTFSNPELLSNGWKQPLWEFILFLAAGYRPENSKWFKQIIECLIHLLPEESGKHIARICEMIPVDAYLRNNHDCFFLAYTYWDLVSKSHNIRVPPFEQTKSVYFSALKDDCGECHID